RFVYRRANLFENVYHPLERQRLLFGQHVAQRAAIEILHYEVSDALGACARKPKVSNVDDVRVAQTSSGARFAFETFDELFIAHELRRDQFEGDITFRTQVRREISCAHAALSEQTLQAVLFVKHLADITLQATHARLS